MSNSNDSGGPLFHCVFSSVFLSVAFVFGKLEGIPCSWWWIFLAPVIPAVFWGMVIAIFESTKLTKLLVCAFLTVVFIALKLTGIISWSWWWTIFPIIAYLTIAFIIVLWMVFVSFVIAVHIAMIECSRNNIPRKSIFNLRFFMVFVVHVFSLFCRVLRFNFS